MERRPSIPHDPRHETKGLHHLDLLLVHLLKQLGVTCSVVDVINHHFVGPLICATPNKFEDVGDGS